MIRILKSQESWTTFARKIVCVLVRFQVVGLIVGAVLTIVAQLLTGFWEFRGAREHLLHQQWTAVVKAQDRFETQLAQIDTVLRGQTLPNGGNEYAAAARSYIRSMEAISRALPKTSTEVADYIGAIADLRKYYDLDSPPQPTTNEWMIFYGEYRQDLDRYVAAREQYLNALEAELGDYMRYVTNL